jgi:hypothetical protein
MTIETDPAPEWARKMQDRWRVPASVVNVFDPMDALWKAQEASRASVWAAAVMGFGNLLHGTIAWFGHGETRSLLTTHLGLSVYFLLLVAGLVLLWMAARMHRAPSVLLSWITLIWFLADVTWISHRIYGHVIIDGYLFLAWPAILGIRGAMGLRRLQQNAV